MARKGTDRRPTRERKRKEKGRDKSSPEGRKRSGSRSPAERKRIPRAKLQRDVTAMNESCNSNTQDDASVRYTPSEAEQMSTGDFVITVVC